MRSWDQDVCGRAAGSGGNILLGETAHSTRGPPVTRAAADFPGNADGEKVAELLDAAFGHRTWGIENPLGELRLGSFAAD